MSTIIPSVPATFTSNALVTFAIPAAFIATSGTWDVVSTVTGTTGSYSDSFITTSDTVVQAGSGGGTWNFSKALSSLQISDVNAAAGGNLSVQFQFAATLGASQPVTSFTLTLNGTTAIIGDPKWGYSFQSASTPFTAVGLSTPCGAVGVSNTGPNSPPAGLTIVYNFGLSYAVNNYVVNIAYGGTSVAMAVDTSPDGTTWTNRYTGNVGSDHLGVYDEEQITYNFAATQTDVYLRLSYKENPQPAATTRIGILGLTIGNSTTNPIPAGASYCSNTGTVTLTGNIKYGTHVLPGVNRENMPLTLFVKYCCNPKTKPCAHPVPSHATPPGSVYCADGYITPQYGTTDCSGNFSFTVQGSILGVQLNMGTWVANPAFTCSAPTSGAVNYTDDASFIPDAQTQTWMNDGCSFGTGFEVIPTGSLLHDVGGNFSDEVSNTNNDVYICPGTVAIPYCRACTDKFGQPFWSAIAGGITFPNAPNPVPVVANTLSGSVSLQVYWGCGGATTVSYYVKDGKYYIVSGIYVTLTDGCGKSNTNLPTPIIGGFDWHNYSSVSVSNWTPNCSPPIGTPFAGPLGGNLIVSGPFTHITSAPKDVSTIYPNYDGKIPAMCPNACATFLIELQPPCIGTTPDRLQADCYKDVVVASWVNSGGALKTSCARAASQKTAGTLGTEQWESPYTVEATNADDIGMVYLPNEQVYLTYLLSGTAKYRLNGQRGASAAWSAAATPSPLVARHSGSCRGQKQAVRVRALGTPSTDGLLQFSQCRDNAGAVWTTPVTITSFAAGPWAGIIYTGNTYVCLFNLSSGTTHGTANGIYKSTSTDGGATWSTPTFTGFIGAVNGICQTAKGTLHAAVWSTTSHAMSVLTSRNQGLGWGNYFSCPFSTPTMTQPPVIAAQGDNVYLIWVTGDTPQYLMNTDGGYVFS